MGNFNYFLDAHKKEVFFGAVLFLASSLSFAVGYVAAREFNHAAIVIEKCGIASQTETK